MKRYVLIPGVIIISLLLSSSSPLMSHQLHIQAMLREEDLAKAYTPPALDFSASHAPDAAFPSIDYSVDSVVSDASPTPDADSVVNDASHTPEENEASEDTVSTAAPPSPASQTPIITPLSTSKWYKNEEKGLKVPILMYHNLLEGDAPGDGLNVSEKVFEDQIHTLKAHGYNAIFFEELHAHYANGDALPENPIIITFDDGYQSNFTIGYPILLRYGMKACIFTITNAIGNANYMNAKEIKEAAASGIIEFQSHSTSHSYTISSDSKDEIRKDLMDSRANLEAITSRKVNIFCYPYGRYSQRMVDELISLDYLFAVTTRHGIASKQINPFLLPRIRVFGTESGKALKEKIEALTGRKTRFVGIQGEHYEAEPLDSGAKEAELQKIESPETQPPEIEAQKEEPREPESLEAESIDMEAQEVEFPETEPLPESHNAELLEKETAPDSVPEP